MVPGREAPLDAFDEWADLDGPNIDTRAAVLSWIMLLCEAPRRVRATKSDDGPAMGIPWYIAAVPDTEVEVTFYMLNSPPYEAALRGVYVVRVRTLVQGQDGRFLI